MTEATTDTTTLAYKQEGTWGTAATGNYQYLRYTGESLKQETQVQESEEITAGRQTSNVRRVGLSAAGSISGELSYGTYDEFFEFGLRGTRALGATVGPSATIASTDADTITSTTLFGSLAVGQWIRMSGWTAAANNSATAGNLWKIIDVVSSSEITVEGPPLTVEGAAASITITASEVIVNGIIDPVGMSIERNYVDLATTYAQFLGMVIDNISCDVGVGNILTCSFDFMGKSEASSGSTIAGTPISAGTTVPFNAIDDVTAVLEGGSLVSVTGISWQSTNNLRTRQIVGTLGATSIGAGKFGATGTLKAYFESATLIDKYLNYTTSSLAFVCKDSAGNYMVFDFPSVSYTDGGRPSAGGNQDIEQTLNFQAWKDATELITMRVAFIGA